MKNLIIIICVFSTFLVSCTASEYNIKIPGHWVGAEWTVDGIKGERNVASTEFTFDERGNYTYNYNGTSQNGTYKIDKDLLYIRPAKEEEFMVKISRISADSMVFIMNRSGSNEVLTLLKK